MFYVHYTQIMDIKYDLKSPLECERWCWLFMIYL